MKLIVGDAVVPFVDDLCHFKDRCLIKGNSVGDGMFLSSFDRDRVQWLSQ